MEIYQIENLMQRPNAKTFSSVCGGRRGGGGKFKRLQNQGQCYKTF